jgi:hypothetical protein
MELACSSPNASPCEGAGFSASPIAADGKIYLLSEDGEIKAL